MSECAKWGAPSCEACKVRGEKQNTLREGDSAYVHNGNHVVVHKYLSPGEHFTLMCPGPEQKP